MGNKITNKTMRLIESWLDDQSIPDEIDILLIANNEPVKMLQLNTITNDYKEYIYDRDKGFRQ